MSNGIVEVSNDGEKVLVRLVSKEGLRGGTTAQLSPEDARSMAVALLEEVRAMTKEDVPDGYERVKKLNAVATGRCQINFEKEEDNGQG